MVTEKALRYAGRMPGGASRQERREYRWVYATTLPLFLVAALVERVLARRPAGAERESLIGEARAMAHTVIPFAYMH